jgi:teichuronic acid biosynthesis glycosyltransferase TuaC
MDICNLRLIILTTEYPNERNPNRAPFLVQQVEKLRESGVDVDVFFFEANRNPLNYFKAWFQFRKILRTNRPEIVHAHFGQSALVALPCPVPLVVTFHGSDLMGIPGKNGEYTFTGRILTFLSRWVSRRADKVICVSRILGEKLPDGVPYEIIPCGINLDDFKMIEKEEARRNLGIPFNAKVIFFPGNPERPVKNYALAKEVIHRLNDENVKLIPAKNIAFSQMSMYYNASDVVLFTSKHEGSPTVIKEAMACNVPIISTNVGDVGELLEKARGNFLVSFDPDIIVKILKNILKKPYRTEGRKSLDLITDVNINKRLIQVYKNILKSEK